MIKDREERLKYYHDYQKQKREMCKRNGICIICEKEKATPGRTTCDGCRKYYREYGRAKRKVKEVE